MANAPDRRIHRLSIRYTVGGVKCVTTHAFAGTIGGSEAPAGLTSDWQIACSAEFRALLSTDCTLDEVEARPVAPSSDAAELPHVRSLGLPGSRTATGDLLPPSWCLGVSLRTDRASRWARGRNYLSGARETDTTSAGFTTGSALFNGLVAAYYAKLMLAFEEGTAYVATSFTDVFYLGVFSRTHYNGGLPQGDYFRPVRSYVVRTAPRSLRSRRQ